MRIDIDRLSEEQLIDLNHRIVARLKFLQEARAHAAMLEFKIGDRVEFTPDGRPPVVGILTRYNRKTVTVLAGNERWNVSPGHLRRPRAANEHLESSPNVVPIKRE